MQTVLSFDYGVKKIGIAVGNTHTKSAQALETLSNKKASPHFARLDELINEWQPDLLLIGLPLNMDGSHSALCAEAKKFGNTLSNRYNLNIEYEDERLSSNQADLLIRESVEGAKGLSKKLKSKRDQIAAVIILKSFFERL